MRVWNSTEPALLNRKHLLAEHRELHCLLSPDWNQPNNPEFRRFSGEYGRGLLVFRHELVRTAMNIRWPNRHCDIPEETVAQRPHPTPVDEEDLQLLSSRMEAILMRYEVMLYVCSYPPAYRQRQFRAWMSKLRWPKCRLDGGATTPWRRDGITASEYVRVGDRWLRSQYHHKAATTKAH